MMRLRNSRTIFARFNRCPISVHWRNAHGAVVHRTKMRTHGQLNQTLLVVLLTPELMLTALNMHRGSSAHQLVIDCSANPVPMINLRRWRGITNLLLTECSVAGNEKN